MTKLIGSDHILKCALYMGVVLALYTRVCTLHGCPTSSYTTVCTLHGCPISFIHYIVHSTWSSYQLIHYSVHSTWVSYQLHTLQCALYMGVLLATYTTVCTLHGCPTSSIHSSERSTCSDAKKTFWRGPCFFFVKKCFFFN